MKPITARIAKLAGSSWPIARYRDCCGKTGPKRQKNLNY
jgi:hypothetical protein